MSAIRFHTVCKNRFMIYLQFKKFISNLLWYNTLAIFVVTQIMQICLTKSMQTDFKVGSSAGRTEASALNQKDCGFFSLRDGHWLLGVFCINGEPPTRHFLVMHLGMELNHCCLPISVTYLFHLLTSCQGSLETSQDPGIWLKRGFFIKLFPVHDTRVEFVSSESKP